VNVRELFLEIGKAAGEEARFRTAVGMISEVVQEMEVGIETEEVDVTEDCYDESGGDFLVVKAIRVMPDAPQLQVTVGRE
jgi:hypothetical protein